MLGNILFNISVLTVSGFTCGLISLIRHDIYRIHKRQYINNISQVFNKGFYIGTALGIVYIINEKSWLCNLLPC